MQLEALKIFGDVARFKSFSRCAEVHGVSQSNASQTVHVLEEKLGAVLIDRSRRPWRLTPAGETFYHGCRDLVHRWEALEAKIKGLPLAQEAEVRVASIYSAGLRHLKRSVQAFERDQAPARAHLAYLHPDQVYEAVASGAADVGVVSFPRPHRDLLVLPWREEPMVLAVPPGHPLAKAKSLEPRALSGEKFVAFDRGLGIRAEVDRFLKKHGATVDVSLEFDNIEAIKRAVEIGSGVSLLPRPTLDNEVRAFTLAAVPLKSASFVRPLAILRRKGPLSPPVARFIDLLESQKTPETAGA
jgi:DNA-binding transcriptional LysR family regulator